MIIPAQINQHNIEKSLLVKSNLISDFVFFVLFHGILRIVSWYFRMCRHGMLWYRARITHRMLARFK